MTKKLSRVALGLAVGVFGVALVASAAGTTASGGKVRHVLGPIQALTLDGSRVAYNVGTNGTFSKGKRTLHRNEVVVWDIRTGKTTKVSGKQTAAAGDAAW